MSFNPFPYIEGAQKATKNYSENRSMDDILRQSREAKSPQEQDDIMAQVLQRVPAERRPEVMQYIQQKQQRLQQANTLEPTQQAAKNALNLVGRGREIAKTGHLGPKIGILGTGRKWGSTTSAEGQKLRAEYRQIGKALVQAAAPLKITNKAEFLHYAEDLEDDSKNLEDIVGSLDALERIIRNSLGEEFNPQQSGNSQQTMSGGGQITDGQTATGPNGQKIVFKGGQWQPI